MAFIVAGIPFVPSVGGELAAYALALGLFGYAIACAFHVRRAFAGRLEDRWSSLGTTLALVLLATATAAWGARVLPAPLGPSLLVPMAGGAVFTLLFTAFRLQRLVDRLKDAIPTIVPVPNLTHEERRKTPHMMMGLGILLYVGLANLVLAGVLGLHSLLGAAPPENLVAAQSASVVSAGHTVGLWLLYAILFLLMPVELVRLRFPDAQYPWKRIILPRLRKLERGLMGAHIHMVVALTLAFLVVAPNPANWDHTAFAALAVLVVTVFADTASALAGRRWGRRKWFHNSDKSYLGSAAGTLTAFAACLPLLGPLGALAAAGAFLLVDFIGPVPIPISDNLLNPFAVGLLLVVVPGLVQPMISL